MPIYAYKCASCGFSQDVLQKVSDAPLSRCPHCQAATFAKQVTAAGFQLKGSGWYATDFKNNGSGKANNASTEPKAPDAGGADKPEKASAASTGSCGHGGCSACS